MVDSGLSRDASPRIDAMVSNVFQRTISFQHPSMSDESSSFYDHFSDDLAIGSWLGRQQLPLFPSWILFVF
jgi:hypothetical protein